MENKDFGCAKVGLRTGFITGLQALDASWDYLVI